ncbi:MAG: helix-turn-helix transcriptional regulator [Phycisphaeraceae bacterium]|nr:helix-turn-helix transcriptional regulator [Phycisphaeraceae bacterium]
MIADSNRFDEDTKMTKRTESDVERFQKDAQANRLLAQEQTIVELTVEICRLMEQQGINRTELSRRLGRTKGQVSQMLGGGRNLTLRTLSDLLLALGRSLEPMTRPAGEPRGRYVRIPDMDDWHEDPETLWIGDVNEEPLKLESEPVTSPGRRTSLAG